jgi:hypothetical protein
LKLQKLIPRSAGQTTRHKYNDDFPKVAPVSRRLSGGHPCPPKKLRNVLNTHERMLATAQIVKMNHRESESSREQLKMRIVLLGCAGSGKTTFARQLGERTGMPVICLDTIWQPHWDEKNVPAFRELVRTAHAGDEWISDGNFSQATFDLRLPRATLVIWLECSRLLCAWRSITRTFKQDEAHRISKLTKVLAFIWNFDRVNRPRIEAIRAVHGPGVPVRTLHCGRDIAAFQSVLGESRSGVGA